MAPDFEIFWEIGAMRTISFLPGGSQVKRPLNPRIEDCCAGGMGDDPYPEIEEVHSSRIEDFDSQTHCFMASLKITSKPN